MPSSTRLNSLAGAALAISAATVIALAALSGSVFADDKAPEPVQSETLAPITDFLKSGARKAGDAIDSAGDAVGDAAKRGLESAKKAGDWANRKSGRAAMETVDGTKDAGRWTADKAEDAGSWTADKAKGAYDAGKEAVQDVTKD